MTWGNKICTIAFFIFLIALICCILSNNIEGLEEGETEEKPEPTAEDQKCMLKADFEKLETKFNEYEAAFGEKEFEVIDAPDLGETSSLTYMNDDEDGPNQYLNLKETTEKAEGPVVIIKQTRYAELLGAEKKAKESGGKCVIL